MVLDNYKKMSVLLYPPYPAEAGCGGWDSALKYYINKFDIGGWVYEDYHARRTGSRKRNTG